MYVINTAYQYAYSYRNTQNAKPTNNAHDLARGYAWFVVCAPFLFVFSLPLQLQSTITLQCALQKGLIGCIRIVIIIMSFVNTLRYLPQTDSLIFCNDSTINCRFNAGAFCSFALDGIVKRVEQGKGVVHPHHVV